MNHAEKAVSVLKEGGVIAYPTEAVFGLGCDPWNKLAVLKVLAIKKRSINKGLILIAADIKQLEPFIETSQLTSNPALLKSWPGPHTWVIPCKKSTPKWLTGDHMSLAVRITAHPIAANICTLFNGAIVSTSANQSSKKPTKSYNDVQSAFSDLEENLSIDYVVDGEIGDEAQVTTIRDAITGGKLR